MSVNMYKCAQEKQRGRDKLFTMVLLVVQYGQKFLFTILYQPQTGKCHIENMVFASMVQVSQDRTGQDICVTTHILQLLATNTFLMLKSSFSLMM